jgi:hypothetical protein
MHALSPLMKKDLFSRLLMMSVDVARKESTAKKLERRPKKKTAYACSSCSDLHHSEDSAMECCRPEELEAYECGRCDNLYRSKDSAASCCESRKLTQGEASAIKASRALELRTVECPVCGQYFGEEGTQAGDEGWPYAARCCLGADLSPAQTWEVGRLVRYERLEWFEALDRVAGGAP